MIVDEVLMKEKKYLIKTLNDETGMEESHLSHIRVIGKRIYTANNPSLIMEQAVERKRKK